jgi:hypothetical protein
MDRRPTGSQQWQELAVVVFFMFHIALLVQYLPDLLNESLSLQMSYGLHVSPFSSQGAEARAWQYCSNLRRSSRQCNTRCKIGEAMQ